MNGNNNSNKKRNLGWHDDFMVHDVVRSETHADEGWCGMQMGLHTWPGL